MIRISSPLLAPVLVSALVLTGCAGTSDDAGPAESSATPSAGRTVFGHVHGLGVDPADGTLYVATHLGVFRVEDGAAELVADRQQDTMGFVVVGENHFLGSGHPDPDENFPPSLGLISSTDAGETWEPLSLLGEADLHSIEVVGDTVYAYDSTSQSLIVTRDGERWTVIAQLLAMRDIATNPDDADTVWIVGDDGTLLSSTRGDEPSPVYDAPPRLAHIDWEPDGPLVGVTQDGAVVVSPDGQTGWEEAGALPEPVEALDVGPGRWNAATAEGVYESTDDGVTWELVLERDA